MELQVLEPEKKTIKFEADPLFSVIIPIHDLDGVILTRCLRSIKDQDYANLEVICVLDGPNPVLRKITESFPFNLIEIEHGGACAARNAGFRISSGDIVSFFNSDYIAKPGMVRMWVDALKNHPDCGFAYGGYEMNSNRRWSYPSKPFSEFELEVANYIDCGFPLWRKYVVEWDVNCKSLQDWDFWIRVVKDHKVKGFYLGRDYSFIAEPPRPKGLTHDSSANWIDRVRYVKTKNNIPERDILVASTGAPNHAVEIAKMIGADYRDDTFDKPHEYKALYNIGFYIMAGEKGLNENARRLAIFKQNYPKAKRVVHFIGADIYWLRKFPWDSLKYLAGALKQSCDHILSENQSAHDELLQFGIPSEIVPIPSYTDNWEVKSLPKDFKVSVYLVEPGHGAGQSNFDKYCYEQTLSIIRAMPDIQFTSYGLGGKGVQYPNLKDYGTISREKWPEYVYENSALLRLGRHDHHPMASNEFLMAGRDVITNIPTPYSNYIDTSGKDEVSSWDLFGEGLNAYRWPETKLKIIQKIREIKKKPSIGIEGTYDKNDLLQMPDAYVNSNSLIVALNKKTYIEKIKGMCNV